MGGRNEIIKNSRSVEYDFYQGSYKIIALGYKDSDRMHEANAAVIKSCVAVIYWFCESCNTIGEGEMNRIRDGPAD